MAVNGLNQITDKILAEAQAEADRILASADERAERILADYRKQADEACAKMREEAERDCTDFVSRARSSAATAKRNAALQTRGELIDKVFDTALANMKALTPDQYRNLLIGLLSAALLEQMDAEVTSRTLYGEEDAMAPAQYEVKMNLYDREHYGTDVIGGVKKKLAGKVPAEKLDRVVLSSGTPAIDGGVILRCGDIESNCSLSMLFAQLRNELEADVGHALFDEPKQN